MKTLLLTLMLASIPSMAEAAKISLDIEYSRFGEKFCEERMIVNNGSAAELTQGATQNDKYVELENIVVIPKVER